MTKRYTLEWKKRISDKLKSRWQNTPLSEATRKKLSDAAKKGNIVKKEKYLKKRNAVPFQNISNRQELKRRLLLIRKECCEKCQWSEKRLDGKTPLQIHHIDGNSKNNILENLLLLCPNCHSLTDNYMFYGKKVELYHKKECVCCFCRRIKLNGNVLRQR